MEDLKKIQEFFSKPLEEVTKSQMLKKAKKGSYPATLVAIENGKVVAQEKVNTPQEAPAAHSVMSKKYPNANIRLEDSTGKILEENVDKKYSDFLVALRDSGITNMFGAAPYLQAEFGLDKREAREVLANWMRSFSESLNENAFVEAFKFEKALKGMGYDVKVKYLDDFGKDVFEIYFNNPADADESIFYDAKKLGYDNVRVFANPQESLDENALGFNDSRLSSDQHRDLDYAVRGDSAYTFGNDPYADDQLRYKYAVKMGFLEEAKKLTYNDFVRMVRDDMNVGSAPDEYVSDERIRKDAKYLYNRYLQGASVDDLFEYNSGIYYDPAKDNMRPKAKEASKSALERVKDMIKKIASEQKMGEALSDYEEEEANYDELYSDYKYKVTEAKPKKGHGEKISKEVFAKLKGKTINYKGHDYKVVDSDEAVLTLKDEDGKSKTINLRQFNISGMIDEIMETIELGKTLEEKLCKKGEAYRKKRLAAGEKSSAYLNGRAVKVCKGQMKG